MSLSAEVRDIIDEVKASDREERNQLMEFLERRNFDPQGGAMIGKFQSEAQYRAFLGTLSQIIRNDIPRINLEQFPEATCEIGIPWNIDERILLLYEDYPAQEVNDAINNSYLGESKWINERFTPFYTSDISAENAQRYIDIAKELDVSMSYRTNLLWAASSSGNEYIRNAITQNIASDENVFKPEDFEKLDKYVFEKNDWQIINTLRSALDDKLSGRPTQTQSNGLLSGFSQSLQRSEEPQQESSHAQTFRP